MKHLKTFLESTIQKFEDHEDILEDVKNVFQDYIDEYDIEEEDDNQELAGIYYTLNSNGDAVYLTIRYIESDIEKRERLLLRKDALNQELKGMKRNKKDIKYPTIKGKYVKLQNCVDNLSDRLENMGYETSILIEKNCIDICIVRNNI